jgi:hypothetical protein
VAAAAARQEPSARARRGLQPYPVALTRAPRCTPWPPRCRMRSAPSLRLRTKCAGSHRTPSPLLQQTDEYLETCTVAIYDRLIQLQRNAPPEPEVRGRQPRARQVRCSDSRAYSPCRLSVPC